MFVLIDNIILYINCFVLDGLSKFDSIFIFIIGVFWMVMVMGNNYSVIVFDDLFSSIDG